MGWIRRVARGALASLPIVPPVRSAESTAQRMVAELSLSVAGSGGAPRTSISLERVENKGFFGDDRG
jgi:hypothetical protein